jgi:hypothetical protein
MKIMNDVIKFPTPAVPEKEDLVFVCECSCQSFYIKDDHVECTNCGTVPCVSCTGSEWRKVLPVLPEDTSTLKDDGGTVTSKVIDDDVFTMKRFIKGVNEWADNGELAALMSYNYDGAGKHWLTINTKERKEWVIRRMEEMLEYVRNKKV